MAMTNKKQPKKVDTLGKEKYCINYPDTIGPIISPIEKVMVNLVYRKYKFTALKPTRHKSLNYV